MTARDYVMTVRRYPPDLWLAAMDIAIGLLHLLSSGKRTGARGFATAKDLGHYVAPWVDNPMRVWGVAFLTLGLLLLWAVLALQHGKRVFAIAWVRIFGPALFVMWAGMYALSAHNDERASWIGVPPYLYLAWRHYYAPASPSR